MARESKRRKKVFEVFSGSEVRSVSDALKVVAKYRDGGCAAKFDESVEVVIKLGIDPKQADQGVRGSVMMPHGLGKKVRVAVVCMPERFDEAKSAGADLYGFDELIEAIKAGKLDFDVVIATPDVMVALSKQVSKILGPKGLMPNPKLGTVSENIADAVRKAKTGQVEYRADKAGIIHAAVGKMSFSEEALVENIRVLYNAVLESKPTGVKGSYIKGAYISTSMGGSIMVDLQ